MRKIYAVASGELSTPGDWYEPPETYACYVEVLAKSRRDARARAAASGLMDDWIEHQRADGRNPFAGLKIEGEWTLEEAQREHQQWGVLEDFEQYVREARNPTPPIL